jgi:hypothetical protein
MTGWFFSLPNGERRYFEFRIIGQHPEYGEIQEKLAQGRLAEVVRMRKQVNRLPEFASVAAAREAAQCGKLRPAY